MKFITSKFFFALVCIAFLLCSYWIYKNVKVSDLIGNQSSVSSVPLNETKVSKPLVLENRDGNIVSVLSPDLVEMVVDYKKIENAEKIISLSYSNTTNKMCFIVQTITPLWVYVGNTDGTELKQIALASKCEISPDGTKAAFINHVTDVSKTDVYIYDFTNEKTSNLTKSSNRVGYQRNYMEIKWNENNVIEAVYNDWDQKNYQTAIPGVSIIDTQSGSVTEKN